MTVPNDFLEPRSGPLGNKDVWVEFGLPEFVKHAENFFKGPFTLEDDPSGPLKFRIGFTVVPGEGAKALFPDAKPLQKWFQVEGMTRTVAVALVGMLNAGY